MPITFTIQNCYAGRGEHSTRLNLFFVELKNIPISTKRIIVRDVDLNLQVHRHLINFIITKDFSKIRRKFARKDTNFVLPEVVLLCKFIPEKYVNDIPAKHIVKRTESGQIFTIIVN